MSIKTVVLALPEVLAKDPNCTINGRYSFRDGKITMTSPNDDGAINILCNYYGCKVVSETNLSESPSSVAADNSLSVTNTNSDAAKLAQAQAAKAEAEAKAKAEAEAKAKAEAEAKAKADAK